LLINPTKTVINLSKVFRPVEESVGELFGIQSKNVILAKVYKNAHVVKKFDIVGFYSSVSDKKDLQVGVVIDKFLLDKEQWLKILCDIPEAQEILNAKENQTKKSSDNVVFRLGSTDQFDFINRFVGIVIEDSTIDKIRFEYINNVNISEGDLLEVSVRDTKVIYQVVQGITNTELLESKNETGIIIGEAVQLGVWDAERSTFEKYGWVPDINSSVWLASSVEKPAVDTSEIQIGTIPNTNYPVLINLDDAISHHIAVLGVTGTGKSVFTRNLIKQIIESDRKVICVDFTNEYKNKIPKLKTIISYNKNGTDQAQKSQADRIFEDIDWISEELEKFANQRDKKELEKRSERIINEFQTAIDAFIKSNEKIGLFELPDVSNTTGILEYTRSFFRTIFDMAKNQKLNKKLCIVIEEAHTVVPEWNFIGDRDKHANSVVNAISQIALQGRKYGIGFIIIAQRTANVSKTVLTQCNSVIAFQQFDKTSAEFLANYMGTAMAEILPNLKFRQAVAVGRGFRTGVPVKFEVPKISE